MVNMWAAIAVEARRSGLLAALRQSPQLTLEQLDKLIHESKYGRELGHLTVAEVINPRGVAATSVHGFEDPREAVLRVFEARPAAWMSSGRFVGFMGLRRWDAQRLLGELAAEGRLERTGKTSATRYRLARSAV